MRREAVAWLILFVGAYVLAAGVLAPLVAPTAPETVDLVEDPEEPALTTYVESNDTVRYYVDASRGYATQPAADFACDHAVDRGESAVADSLDRRFLDGADRIRTDTDPLGHRVTVFGDGPSGPVPRQIRPALPDRFVVTVDIFDRSFTCRVPVDVQRRSRPTGGF